MLSLAPPSSGVSRQFSLGAASSRQIEAECLEDRILDDRLEMDDSLGNVSVSGLSLGAVLTSITV